MLIIRPPKKLFCCPPPPAPIFLNSEKVFTAQKNTYLIFEIPEKGWFFFFKIEIYFEHVSKQFSTLLNWFKELLKWAKVK